MIAVDTNILARFILNDDVKQSDMAGQLLGGPFYLSYSVLTELGWVLEKSAGLARAQVADALTVLVDMAHCNLADRDGVRWAINRYRAGADWADMVHLVAAAPCSDRFCSFDRKLASRAGPDAPLTIETV